MADLAERVGAERLITGHYARIVGDGDGPLLAAAADSAKDQSYMLAGLPPEMLPRLGFPLTELTKPEVREIAARERGSRSPASPRARTSASSPARASARFLRRHGDLGEQEGSASSHSGREIGRHRGHHNFTVGQRRGIGSRRRRRST